MPANIATAFATTALGICCVLFAFTAARGAPANALAYLPGMLLSGRSLYRLLST